MTLWRIAAALLIQACLGITPALANDLSNATWSETDASNTAASPNGWPANMPSNQVAPSARAMMGAVKRWYDHANPTVTSGGSANAQTLTYAAAPAAYVAGDCYTFIAGASNTGATTLNINALGAKTVAIGGGTLTGGEIVATRPVQTCFDGTNFQLMSGGAIATAQGGTGQTAAWTAGAIPYLASATKFGQDSSGLFVWDGGNHRLGVGTASPAERLHVADATSRGSFTGTAAGVLAIEGFNGNGQYVPLDFRSATSTAPIGRIALEQTGTGSYLYFGTSNNFVNGITNAGLALDPAGNTLLTGSLNVAALATAGSATLCYNANQFVTGYSGITACSSDARLKTDPIPLKGDANAVLGKLHPSNWRYKADDTHRVHAGFIAQDVESAIPEAVYANPDGKKNYETNAVVAYAVRAIQDDDRRIGELWAAMILGWLATLGLFGIALWRRA